MEQILDFIFDNLFWLIIAFVFLSGFFKSKKKRGERVEQDLNQEEQDRDFSLWEEDDQAEELPAKPQQTARKSPWDKLPVPAELKELMDEFRIDDEEEEEETPWQRWQRPTPPPAPPRPRHYDAPYSGEGKVSPHREVKPSYTNADPYASKLPVPGQTGLAKAETPPNGSGNLAVGKRSKTPVSAITRDAYAPNPVADMLKAASTKKLAEAVIMAEILAKPKALRQRGSRI